eukprot:353268-Chlamydomonas_euryale.AAC.2
MDGWMDERGAGVRDDIVGCCRPNIHVLKLANFGSACSPLLRPLFLAHDREPARHVRDAHRAVGYVDVLAAGAACSERLDAQILLPDLAIDLLKLKTLAPAGCTRHQSAARFCIQRHCCVRATHVHTRLVSIGEHHHAGGARVHSALRLCRRHALHAVHARLVRHARVCARAGNRGAAEPQSSKVGTRLLQSLKLPAAVAGVAAVN